MRETRRKIERRKGRWSKKGTTRWKKWTEGGRDKCRRKSKRVGEGERENEVSMKKRERRESVWSRG